MANRDLEFLSSGEDIILLDTDGGGNLVYVGRAGSGTSTASLLWSIKKLGYDGSGNLASVYFADSTPTYTKSWDSRASYTYS